MADSVPVIDALVKKFSMERIEKSQMKDFTDRWAGSANAWFLEPLDDSLLSHPFKDAIQADRSDFSDPMVLNLLSLCTMAVLSHSCISLFLVSLSLSFS